MDKEVGKILVGGIGSLVAMVLIWRLVVAALVAGIDGLIFFTGMAAIAGLGGYELRWLINGIQSTVKPKQ